MVHPSQALIMLMAIFSRDHMTDSPVARPSMRPLSNRVASACLSSPAISFDLGSLAVASSARRRFSLTLLPARMPPRAAPPRASWLPQN
jgi:hypothetical protein